MEVLAAAVVVALGLRRVFFGYPGPGVGVLARREAAFVAAAAEAMFPPGGTLGPSGIDAGIVGFVARYLAAVPPRVRLLMRALFFLTEHVTLVFWAPAPRGWRRFSSLSPGQRVALLEGWQRSGFFALRLVFMSLRAILTMGYFADPRVLRELRLAPYEIPTPVLDADLLYPPIGCPRSEIRHRADDRTPPSDGTPLALDGPLHPAYRSDDGVAGEPRS